MFESWRLPFFEIPALPNLTLSEQERATLERLRLHGAAQRRHMLLSEAYYLGEQVIKNLRIAVPKELEFLRTIVGWPALAVDPYVEKHRVDCFRLPTSTDADQDLTDIWQANGLDAELPLAITDALSLGRGYWLIGSGENEGDAPVITVESPLNIAVEWSANGKTATAGLQEYWRDHRRHAALYLQGATIQLAWNDKEEWEIVDRDPHGFDPPIVRMAHQPRTTDRNGRSAISPAIRSITDSACRTLLGLEVAREMYSVQKEIWLGAAEKDFINSDGSMQSRYDAYMTRIKMIERDEDGELPEVKQLQAYDPGVFTKLIDMYASQAASLLCAPPQDLGLYTQGNPVSPDTVDAQESRRNERAKLQQAMFGVDLQRVMQWAVRFQNGGTLPRQFGRMMVDWEPVENPGLAARADFVQKLTSGDAPVIPPHSDVTLARAGFSAIERARIAQDRTENAGAPALDQLADELAARRGDQPNGS